MVKVPEPNKGQRKWGGFLFGITGKKSKIDCPSNKPEFEHNATIILLLYCPCLNRHQLYVL